MSGIVVSYKERAQAKKRPSPFAYARPAAGVLIIPSARRVEAIGARMGAAKHVKVAWVITRTKVVASLRATKPAERQERSPADIAQYQAIADQFFDLAAHTAAVAAFEKRQSTGPGHGG